MTWRRETAENGGPCWVVLTVEYRRASKRMEATLAAYDRRPEIARPGVRDHRKARNGRTQILHQDVAGFLPRTLVQVYGKAVAELQRRLAAGDPVVEAYFGTPDQGAFVEPPVVTPWTEPSRTAWQRGIRAQWNIGPAYSNGWQPQALLDVVYDKAIGGFEARLLVAEVDYDTVGGLQLIATQRLLSKTPWCTVTRLAATKFVENVMWDFYHDALAQLRGHYEEGNELVRSFFDPAAEMYVLRREQMSEPVRPPGKASHQ
ncbi:hypothetical protein D5S17_35735 [Pseudonocardiaceae bacterium YIM PH 21723]|nr:hypothetical protein D5S17_35735 [Pseudonocardiaceae bacterium YIM PH 21723]